MASEDTGLRPAETPRIVSRAASTLHNPLDDPEKGVITPQKSRGSSDAPHVDIAAAKAEFAQLDRQFSRSSKPNKTHDHHDAEKGDIAEEESVFDLREYLTTTHSANENAGIRHKHVGVTWKGLGAEVPNMGSKFYARLFPAAIWETLSFPVMYPLGLLQSKFGSPFPTKPILQNFDGVLKPGEMCLVLGVPGSGCTTFLKVIANERGDYANVSGNVEYAGIGFDEMNKSYSGEVVYNQEDDIHIPTLTVEQTLEFALSTKTPGKRLPGVTGKDFNKEVMDTLLKMLSISHTRNTLVGNEYVRGVSGGERKRVSIVEMMATRAHVVSYDNSTRGLDASTALDFAKGLRVTTDILGQTTFVSLYQASESIYNLFDKVLVIDQGRAVYFGSAKEARQYFVSLGYRDMPRQSTADFLTACTDPNERQVAPGVDPKTVPGSPQELEAAFRASSHFKRVEQEREDYEKKMHQEKWQDQEQFRLAVLDSKRKGVSKKNPYTLSFFSQVKALTVRQFRLQLQDSFTLWTSFWISTILAIVLGATYYNLPATTSGGFTRGSVMFIAMLVNCLDAFAEMPTQMVGRPIFLKQSSYKLYRPSALSFANTLADIPFSAIRIFVFNVIVYFMSGLKRNGGAFWTFHLMVYLAFLTLQGFFRTIGIVCPSFESAFRLAALFLPNMVSYAGYLIPRDSMRVFMEWIFYINPMGYSFSGLMENEFGRLDMECDGNYIIPRNAPGESTYPSGLGPNQVCTFFGSRPGESIVKGPDYVKVGYFLNVDDLWKLNFVVLLVFFFAFQVAQTIAMEMVEFPSAGGFQIFIKENDDTKERNKRLKERKETQEKHSDSLDSNFEMSGKALTWRDVNYTVPTPAGPLRLLHDVTGYCKPKTLTALMGASGAGKTTALDVLAQRKNVGVVTGSILLEGQELTASFARETAYAEQMDVHEGTSTVREAMRFSAYLRQPYSVSQAEKDDYVESIIELLELQDLAESLVFTLGVEARKRLTIAVELASRPGALLFLDEPTSGLDAQSAFNLVRFLRKLAAAGQAILCTIHQPSSLLFENFDRLLLLERGGETVYFGDIGPDSAILRDYLARNGAVCPDDVNPAEFMLEAIGAGSSRRIGPMDWKDIWLASPEYKQVLKEIETIEAESRAGGQETKEKPQAYATPLLYQLKVVSERAAIALWRSPDYIWTRMFVHIVISLLTSLTFLQLGNSVRDLQFRVFGIFWVTVLPAIVVNQIEPAFIFNRMTFVREASSGMYSPFVFATAQLLAEIPYSIACAVLYWVLMYFPMGLGQGQGGMGGSGYYLLMIIFVELFGVTMGQAIGALSPTIKIALLANPPIALILTTFAGVTIPYPNLSSFWRSWMYELNPYTRVVAGLTVVELKGLEIVCKADEFAVFEPPSGQTCQSWAGSFVDKFGGYIQNASATASCQYCPYKVGDEFFTPLNMSYENRWRDLFIVFAFFAFNGVVTVIASRYLRYAKR